MINYISYLFELLQKKFQEFGTLNTQMKNISSFYIGFSDIQLTDIFLIV